MTGMKHSVDKGQFFSLLDSRYSSSVDERVRILEAMRDAEGGSAPNVFRDAGTLNPNLMPAMVNSAHPIDNATANTRMRHLYEHWFGYEADPQQQRVQAPGQPETLVDWVPTDEPQTGWWSEWRGDAFDIFRTTIIRAIEVSLGLKVGGNPRRSDGELKTSMRAWPIEFLWICGAPKFEGWVTWRKHNGSARVLVLLVTPSIRYDPPEGYESGITLSLTPGLGNVSGNKDYELIATGRSTKVQECGLWVIGHELSFLVPEPGAYSWNPTDDDEWLFEANEKNTGVIDGSGSDVVTVQPAEVDGGVLMGGRPWT